MPKYQYKINKIQFNSKKAVIEHVRNILNSYADHEPLSIDHCNFMSSLLRHHPWSDQKIGVGIKQMWVQMNENFPTRGFWLEREDGTKTDFSFYQCISPPSLLRDFKAACRRSIAPLVIDFRQKHFQVGGSKCPVLGCDMTLHTAHVDHEPPQTFEQIVGDFIKMWHIDVEKAPLMEHVDGKVGCWFTDVDFERQWIEFHNERAHLRVISAEANLALG